MEISKEQIKQNFIKDCHFLIEESDNERLNKLIDELCDLSMPVVIRSNERETFILRKRLGVFDNGEVQTYRVIGQEIERSHDRVRQILMKSYRTSFLRAKKDLIILETNENQSDDIMEKTIEHLGLSTRTYNCLNRTGIKNVRELVRFGAKRLSSIRNFGKTNFEEITTFIHELGLQFIDEQIASNSISVSKEELLDTSIASINLSSHTYNCLNRAGISTVKDVTNIGLGNLHKIRNFNKNDKIQIIDIIHNLGLKFADEQVIMGQNSELSMEEILDTEITNLFLSVRLYNCLNRAGLKNVRDIVKLNSNELCQIRNLGPSCQEELIEKVHSLGLYFINEVEVLRSYSETISTELDSQLSSAKQRKEELVSRYKALTSEKANLEARSQELDVEINEVMQQINGMNKGVKNGQTK